MSSQNVGSGLASFGAFVFFYYSAWIFVVVIIIQPFLDRNHWVQDLFLDKIWAVRIPQILMLIGILVLISAIGITFICKRKEKVA